MGAGLAILMLQTPQTPQMPQMPQMPFHTGV